jgi:hypothetical protein
LAEARKRIEETYGDSDIYLAETLVDTGGVFMFRVTNSVPPYSFRIIVQADPSHTPEQAPIQAIMLTRPRG